MRDLINNLCKQNLFIYVCWECWYYLNQEICSHLVTKNVHFVTSLPVPLIKNMSQCEHTHLAHYKHFCFYCNVKFYYPEILRVVRGLILKKCRTANILHLAKFYNLFSYNNLVFKFWWGQLCFWVRSSSLRIPDNILSCFPVNLCQMKWPIIFNYAFWSFYFY